MRARFTVLLLLVLIGSAPASYAAPAESGPLVIDEVFLGGSNLTSFLNGVQWIELVNTGAWPVSVQGLRLVADDHPALALTATDDVPPGGFFVVLVTDDPAVALAAELAGPLDFPLQVALGGQLPVAPASLSLESADGTLDWLPLGAAQIGADLPGSVLTLDPTFLSPEGNNEPSHWCASIDKTSLLGNLVNGTPGLANPFCDNDADGYSEADGDCLDDDAGVAPGLTEICDGLDNDCDGQTDDVAWLDGGVGATACPQAGACFGAVPACHDGAWTCPEPEGYEAVEVSCDALDNDCDGQTDEALTNACGLCGALASEVCDGLDNDCDGVADDDVTPPQGACPQVLGVCAGALPACAGATGWQCDYGPAHEANESLCDGQDNDCDGNTDESYPLGEACVVDVRACQSVGVWSCSSDHQGVVCVAPPVGSGPELCGDGVDNDCNGRTDEGYPVGDACEVGTGTCRATGRYACTDDDLGVVCDAAPLQAGAEACDDGLDNDCDGQVDELDCTARAWSDDEGLQGGVRCSASPSGSAPATPGLLLMASLLLMLWGKRRTYGVT
jgi:hypothetical protein